jgi:Icc-related predicted phosphoesterase
MYYREGAFAFRGLTWFVASFHEDAVCNQIPENVAPVHIFVTHVAALGSPGEGTRNKGSQAILNARNKLKPKIHLFGHAHSKRGHYGIGSDLVEINCSQFDDVSALRPPYYLTISPGQVSSSQ